MFCLSNECDSYLADITPSPVLATKATAESPDLAEFWSMETIGIKESPNQSDDEKAIHDFQSHITKEKDRYFVSLPWNEKIHALNVDYGLCMGSLETLLCKLKTNSELFKQYSQIIQQQEELGIIEKVEPNKNEQYTLKHYIPHHAVIKESSETTKVRIVFDGSAKARKGSPSLNDCLFRGPVLLEDLTGLLLRFRLQPIAVVLSDIEKAFLQVAIREQDRNPTRFLWLKDTNKCDSHDNVQEYRFARVLFGLNCSPALLAQTIQHHLSLSNTEVSKQIREGLYVDNVITGVQNAQQGERFYKEAKALFQAASMNLREWTSNSKELMSKIPSKDKAKPVVMKILGLQWDTSTDTLSVRGPTSIQVDSATTKRQLLAATATVFDPLGYFTPCTIQARVNLQKASQLKHKMG